MRRSRSALRAEREAQRETWALVERARHHVKGWHLDFRMLGLVVVESYTTPSGTPGFKITHVYRGGRRSVDRIYDEGEARQCARHICMECDAEFRWEAGK